MCRVEIMFRGNNLEFTEVQASEIIGILSLECRQADLTNMDVDVFSNTTVTFTSLARSQECLRRYFPRDLQLLSCLAHTYPSTLRKITYFC